KKAHQEGRWAPWRQGLSGKKDANIEKINKKISSTLKKRYASGDLVAWRSKNTDQTNWNRSHSQNLKSRYDDGSYTSWVTGLTSDTDDRILAKSLKLKTEREKIIASLQSLGWCSVIDVPQDDRPGRNCVVSVECNTCRMLQVAPASSIKDRCQSCNPGCSQYQLEIIDWIKS